MREEVKALNQLHLRQLGILYRHYEVTTNLLHKAVDECPEDLAKHIKAVHKASIDVFKSASEDCLKEAQALQDLINGK